MIRIIALWLIALVSLLSLGAAARADEKAMLAHVEKFRDGSGFFQKDEFRKAALAWSNDAVAILEQQTGKSATLAAGFASVLSSIAYQRAEDALAYAQWGNATKHFLSAGTSWDDQREILFDYLTQVKQQLEDAAEDSATAHMEPSLQFLIALDSLTGFSVYYQPGTGLSMQDNALEPVVTENRSYFARPLSVVQQDEQAISARQSEHIANSLQNLAAEPEVADEPQPSASADSNVPAGDGSRERPFKIEVKADAGGSKTAVPVSQVQPGVAKPVEVAPTPVPTPAPATKAADAAKSDEPVELKKQAAQTVTAASTTKKPADERKASAPVAQKKGDDPKKAPSTMEPVRDYQLSETDLQRAQRAWSYFERNRHPDSGFVSSSEGSAEVSSWDMAGQLAAIVSAHQIGVIDDDTFSRLTKTTLRAIEKLPLYDDRLPNRLYRVDTAQMSPTERGWSAVSSGRMLIWLRILANWYPEFRERVMAAISRWQFSQAIANGQLNSATELNGDTVIQQEGRLGFEQYAAAGFRLWGLDVDRALALPETGRVNIYNIELDTDKRPSSALVSDPFVLGAMELSGVHTQFAAIGENVYRAQRARWRNQKRLTAKGRDVHQQAGQLVSNHVYHADRGTAFNCSLPDGSAIACQSISTKIAYGWHALYGDDYSQSLVDVIEKGVSSVRGFYAGVFEDLTVNRVLTLDANAMVLESLLLKFRHGEPFLQASIDDADQTLLFSSGSWD